MANCHGWVIFGECGRRLLPTDLLVEVDRIDLLLSLSTLSKMQIAISFSFICTGCFEEMFNLCDAKR